MALNAEVLTSYKQIDEAYIDELLKKEIEKIKQSMSGKLPKIPKNISDTIKQSFQNIKSGAPFSAMIQNTRQYVKEAQLAAGIKVHTKEV